jgi:hypothetical protein
MKGRATLKAVEAVSEPPPNLDYEHRQRAHILSRNWARVHVEADRREPLHFFDRITRTWAR